MKIRFESETKHPHMQPCFQKLVHWKPIWDKLNLLHASLLCGVLLDKVDQSIGGGVVWSHWTRGLKLWLNRLSQLFAQFHAARKDHRRNNPLITEHGCVTVEFQSTLAKNATLKCPVKSNERFSTLPRGTRTSARKGVWAFGDFFFRDSPRQHRKIVFRHESIGVKIYNNLNETVMLNSQLIWWAQKGTQPRVLLELTISNSVD